MNVPTCNIMATATTTKPHNSELHTQEAKGLPKRQHTAHNQEYPKAVQVGREAQHVWVWIAFLIRKRYFRGEAF